MVYKLQYSKNADKQLEKMDINTARVIIKWMDANINNSVNPRSKGKPLNGKMHGYWRYRVGKIRVICQIKDESLIVLAICIGKRENVYPSFKNNF